MSKRRPACMQRRYTKIRDAKAVSQGNICYWCELQFTESNPPTTEHLIPVSDGGSQDDPDNIVAACGTCNGLRSVYGPKKFLVFLKSSHRELTQPTSEQRT